MLPVPGICRPEVCCEVTPLVTSLESQRAVFLSNVSGFQRQAAICSLIPSVCSPNSKCCPSPSSPSSTASSLKPLSCTSRASPSATRKAAAASPPSSAPEMAAPAAADAAKAADAAAALAAAAAAEAARVAAALPSLSSSPSSPSPPLAPSHAASPVQDFFGLGAKFPCEALPPDFPVCGGRLRPGGSGGFAFLNALSRSCASPWPSAAAAEAASLFLPALVDGARPIGSCDKNHCPF